MPRMHLFVGLDVGGSSMKAGVVDDHGQPLSAVKVKMCFIEVLWKERSIKRQGWHGSIYRIGRERHASSDMVFCLP